MINFEQLPTENPFSVPKPDVYKATIVEASMKESKSVDANGNAKPPYLNVKYSLTDGQGGNAGTFYDIISESDSSVVLYKIGRFIRACGLPLTGAMELKDIAKLVVGRTIALDIKVEKDSKGTDRAQVDLFSRQAYYLLDEFAEEYSLLHPDENAPQGDIGTPTDSQESEVPFDAPDGGATAQAPSPANY